jgi:hypothetical protein
MALDLHPDRVLARAVELIVELRYERVGKFFCISQHVIVGFDQQLAQPGLAIHQRQLPQIAAVELQQSTRRTDRRLL